MRWVDMREVLSMDMLWWRCDWEEHSSDVLDLLEQGVEGRSVPWKVVDVGPEVVKRGGGGNGGGGARLRRSTMGGGFRVMSRQ